MKLENKIEKKVALIEGAKEADKAFVVDSLIDMVKSEVIKYIDELDKKREDECIKEQAEYDDILKTITNRIEKIEELSKSIINENSSLRSYLDKAMTKIDRITKSINSISISIDNPGEEPVIEPKKV